MNKSELVTAIRLGIAGNAIQTKVDNSFLRFFVEYLESFVIPDDEKCLHWTINPYLPEIIAGAHEELRTGQGALASKWRHQYEANCGREIPHLTDLGQGSLVHHAIEVSSIASAFARIMVRDGRENNHIRQAIEAYCNAQVMLLQQTFDAFARRVYRKGMFEIVRDCDLRGMNGKFNDTCLRSYVIAGRIMFTFCRESPEKPEPQVTFVASDTDPLLLTAGIQSASADVSTCRGMILDVVAQWPSDPDRQKQAFYGEDDVKPDVVAAMEAAKS